MVTALTAEIGKVIERYLVAIGLMHKSEPDEHQKKLIVEKRAEFEAAAVVMMDGRMTCLNCGDSSAVSAAPVAVM